MIRIISYAIFVAFFVAGCGGGGTEEVSLAVSPASTATLMVTRDGNGTGTVTSDATGIACGADCDEAFTAGSVITLSATANTDSDFTGWSGGGCSGTNVCTVRVASATNVTATFALKSWTLTTSRAGNGDGSVASSPAGINCGADCSEAYLANTVVTLTPVATKGSTFVGWSGAGCSGTGTCVVTVTAALTVTATFDLTRHMMSVTRSGTGTGSVDSAPAGITCGADCSETYNFGTAVTLTAKGDLGSTFSGWSGAGCVGVGTCVVTVSAATTVDAQFTAATTQTIDGSWTCDKGSCQDVYDFTFKPGSTVTIEVTGVNDNSVLRLGAFSPGVKVDGNNLLTGLNFDRRCGKRGNGDSVQFLAAKGGNYLIAIGRDGGESAGAIGNYAVTVSVSRSSSLIFNGRIADDVATSAKGMQCGYTFTASGAWACEEGVSCQDVFDFTTVAETAVTVEVTKTGSSWVRMALFDGSALNTSNRLLDKLAAPPHLADRLCYPGQFGGDIATSPFLPTGRHRVAIGRDWRLSDGGSGSGTYTVTLTTANTPLSITGRTVNDTASAFDVTRCEIVLTASAPGGTSKTPPRPPRYRPGAIGWQLAAIGG